MANLEVDLSKIPGLAVREVYQNFRVALPAAALSFDRDTSRITGSPRVQFQTTARKLITDPDVPGVPVIGYAGGGYVVAFDLVDGDPVLMLACDGPVSGYYETGNASPPGAGTTSHSLGSMVAFPGGRVSDPNAPTPPANAAGECLVGAVDGSAALRLRGAGLTDPAELGTVVLAAANPTAGVLLGADDATVGVVRLGDAVAPTADMTAFVVAVAGFINGIVPGTIPPNVIAALATKVGQSSEASVQVLSK